MEHLYAPWRMAYIESPQESPGCFLCDFPAKKEDEATKIVWRGITSFVIMNIFPYNPGHLMVVPYRHLASYELLDAQEIVEMGELLQKSLRVLRIVSSPEGFNMGMNMGKVAGAGCDGHIHMHVVPRWGGDTNFTTLLGDLRVVPQAMEETYKRILKAWNSPDAGY